MCSFLIHSKHYPNTNNISIDLFKIAFSFHANYKNDDHSVSLRTAVLFSLVTAFDNMEGYDSYHLITQHNVQGWVRGVKKSDTNENNRKLAAAVVSFCKSANSIVPM